jgi:hypothetical protein
MMDAELSIPGQNVLLTVSVVFVTILAVYGAVVTRFERNLGGLTAISADYLIRLPW